MSLLRKQTKSHYAHIANDILQDPRLSFRARGIAANLLSRPDDWVIRVETLAREAKEGEKAILSAMKELATYGYLRRARAHDALGHIYTITELADYPAFADDGTPQDRRFGYTDPPETAGSVMEFTDPTKTGGSVRESTDPPETEPSVNRGSGNRGVGFGGVIINTDLPIPDLPIPNTNSDANASGQAAPAPADSLADAFRNFHDELKAEPEGHPANRAEILRRAYLRCYGGHDAPDHARLGAFARTVGGWGMALDMLWSATARSPNGDVLAYLETQYAARKRDRSNSFVSAEERRAINAQAAAAMQAAVSLTARPATPAHPREPDGRDRADPWAVTLYELRQTHPDDALLPTLDGSRLVPADAVDGVPLYRILLPGPAADGYRTLSTRFGAVIRRKLTTILHTPVLIEFAQEEPDHAQANSQ